MSLLFLGYLRLHGGMSNRPVLTATRSDKTQNTVELMSLNPEVTGKLLLVFLHSNEKN